MLQIRPPLLASTTKYALQLRQGFGWLRFDAPLEAEYRAYCGGSGEYRRVLWFSGLSLLLWLAFALFGLWSVDAAGRPPAQQSLLEWLHALHLGVAVLIVLTLAGALWRAPLHLVHAALLLSSLALGCGAALVIYAQKLLGVPHEGALLVLVVVGLFTPFAISLWWHGLVALIFLACVTALAWAAPLPGVRAEMLRLDAVLALSALLFGCSAYWREHQRREQFLYRGDAHWLAMRDALTGLYNRRMFNHHLDQVMAHARREGLPLLLLLVDVDYFRAYNDSHGQQQGDAVLQQVAQVALACIGRPLDMVARVGGEKFAVLLYGSSAAHARALGQSLVAGVRQRALAHDASPVADVVTVSVGGAMLQPEDRPQSIYARAERVLHEAKSNGRDRCNWEAAFQA